MLESQHRVVQSEAAERYFNCRYCGARGEVVFHAKGDSGWHKEGLFESDGAARAKDAAEADLLTDAERVLHLIKCPTCKRRDDRYVRWAAIRIAAWLVLGLGAYLIAGEFLSVIHDVPVWVAPVVFVVLGGVQAWVEGSRFKRADRAEILRLQPGKPTDRPAPIPKATAAAKKPITLPVRPIAAAPVVPVQQRGPDDEPAFLTKKD